MTPNLDECTPKAVTELIVAKTVGQITPLATIFEIKLVIKSLLDNTKQISWIYVK